MKVAQKPRRTARFRRYELVSVCGIRQWRRHSCLLSQRAFFGVSFLLCALDAPRRAVGIEDQLGRPACRAVGEGIRGHAWKGKAITKNQSAGTFSLLF